MKRITLKRLKTELKKFGKFKETDKKIQYVIHAKYYDVSSCMAITQVKTASYNGRDFLYFCASTFDHSVSIIFDKA